MNKYRFVKLALIILTAALSVSMFACDNNNDTPTTGTSAPEVTESATAEAVTSEPETATETVSETESESETVSDLDSESASESASQSETVTETESELPSETESETVFETQTEVKTETYTGIYSDGEPVENAGCSFDFDAFQAIDHELDESAAVSISASELLEILKNKTATSENVFRVSETISFTSDTKYYGNGAAIIAEGGIMIKDSEEIVVKELIIKGNISVENSTGITLFRLDMTSEGCAISIDSACSDIAVKSCRIHTTETAVSSAASLFSAYQNSLFAKNGLIMSGNDSAAQRNIITAEEIGISASGAYTTLMNNVITAGEQGVGISMLEGSYNSMAALNTVTKAQSSISISGGYNCSVLLNSAVSITANGNDGIYIVDNKLGGMIALTNNKHLICDGNTFLKDGKPHYVKNEGNSEYNGDGLHNVDERLEAGANEELLPHTNKDLFIGMERRGEVRDLTQPKSFTLMAYVRNMAKDNGVVIIPPGAYSAASTLNLQSTHSNTTVYAYGVYQEATKYTQVVNLTGTSNVTIKGLTMGYSLNSSGQAQVLKKLGDKKLLMVSSAGFGEAFGALDNTQYVTGGSGVYLFHPGSFTSWTELGAWGGYNLVENELGEYINPDGTFTIELTGNQSAAYYELVEIGEVFTCRINDQDPGTVRTVNISNSSSILLKDTVIYGYADAMAVIIGGLSRDVVFYRHHNLAHSGAEIDKDEYDRYAVLEELYGVDLVSVDSEDRFRGPDARTGSIDAAHVLGASEGLTAISTLFENACDDASNQRGDSSCLHQIIDNNDGTSTIVYKANPAQTYYNMYKDGRTTATGIETRPFEKDDRIFIYASNGHIVCDTTVLSATAQRGSEKYIMFEEDYQYGGQTIHWVWSCYLYEVTVKTEDINMAALEGYELGLDSPSMDNKVIVDNMSRNSMGILFDNVMVRNNRGRIMLKTRDVTIKNCTFKDTSYAAVVMSCESTWGESSVAQDVNISNCIFDCTSQTFRMERDTKFAAVAIEGLGNSNSDVTVDKDSIPAKNITIEGNIFRFGETGNNYYLTIIAAQNVKIKNNTFETRVNDGDRNVGKAILVRGCLDVEISDNSFSDFASEDNKNVITAVNYQNLYGNDVAAFDKDNIPTPAQ